MGPEEKISFAAEVIGKVKDCRAAPFTEALISPGMSAFIARSRQQAGTQHCSAATESRPTVSGLILLGWNNIS